ncbi:hypothetical protein BTN49_2795 [Candidatus Enterovibrio escicola]|uniref:Uncharacterized protein n=1 Tax=Candidatus Enterovibrio escicola TaxID=1927127 RepID=A0A2A5T0E6_9GAMM|nr:hypothetical protein BTN49_2795 [Candidatus Enterovibrio escacola]
MCNDSELRQKWIIPSMLSVSLPYGMASVRQYHCKLPVK